ncbi:phage holin [Paenibacillus sp. Marseille-Q4541]|uniref:phage holin n=1 Tax=Paenibacillus sp. Marseille-Q4541 TaxID=2831522 RepID=UPI001BA5BAC2|nr:phage holin [Paenibacillus sp. Marseille-Q4541]
MIIKDIMDQAQPFISSIVVAIVGLLATIVIGAVNKLKKKASDYFDANLSVKQRELLHKVASEAFAYAETLYGQYDGEKKMEHAYAYVSDKLGDAGMSITPQEIRAAIEKAWVDNAAKKRVNRAS